MKIKAVLFDMDGVLVDSETYYMEGTLKWMQSIGFTGTFKDVCTLIGTTMDGTYRLIEKMMDYQYTREELERINKQYFNVDHPIQYGHIMTVE